MCRQGRNEGTKGAQFAVRREVLTMSQVLSSIQYIGFRKTSGSNRGTPILLLAQGAMNFGRPVSLSGKLANICLIYIIAYSG